MFKGILWLNFGLVSGKLFGWEKMVGLWFRRVEIFGLVVVRERNFREEVYMGNICIKDNCVFCCNIF